MRFIFLFFCTQAFGYEWKRSAEKFQFISDKLIYSNRAECAARAKIPTRQVFIVVDNVSIAKAAYRLAKIKEINPETTTKLAVEKFRYGLTKLTSNIGKMLLSGTLPFIDSKEFSNDKIRANWEKRQNKIPIGDIKCRRIIKFGSLLSPLNVSRPDHFLLNEVGKDLEKLDESFQSCEDFSDESSSDIALYRFDIDANPKFDKVGFIFWASLKIYLAWALRFSPEMKELSAPFDSLFRGADIEEALLFFSSTCESISNPECSDRDITLDSLQELTTPGNAIDFQEAYHYRPITDASINQLISSPLPLKEDDLLHLSDYSSSNDWLENFRENFLKAKGFQKIRLSRAFSNLLILSLSTSFEKIQQALLAESLEDEKGWKEELFYLCAEYGGPSKGYFSNFTKDIELLRESHLFSESIKGLDESVVKGMINLFDELSHMTKILCLNLEERKVWEAVEIDRLGLAPWYLHLSGAASSRQRSNIISSQWNKNYLIQINDQETLCQSASHCARILLDSLMTISMISRSLPSITSGETILSANLGNPYATRVACGLYDPWEKRNRMIYRFFHDLAQSAILGIFPSPVYVSVDIDSKKITSFATLLNQGKVVYHPIYNRRKVHLSLIGDLGPLIGVPCSISISGNPINPLEYYSFDGISFSGCRENGKNEVRVSSGDEISRNVSFRQYCGACAINLRTISSAVGRLHPAFRFNSFLLKAVVRLIQSSRDPHDIPRSWSVDTHHIALSYRYWGELTPWCAKKILRGESCLPKKCERKMVEAFTSKFDVSPISSSFSCALKKGVVRVKECSGPINLTFFRDLRVKTNCILKERKK